MILEVFLHSLKSAGVGGDLAPPFANRLPACGVEKVHMASVVASPRGWGERPRLQIECLHDGI